MTPCATSVAVATACAVLMASQAEARPRSKRQSFTTESCLPASIKRELAHIRKTFGPIRVVSTRAPRARKSYHPHCRAVDFHPAKDRRKAVVAHLRATWRGGLGVYSGRMAHIHIDDGPRYRWHTRVSSPRETLPADRPPPGIADGSPVSPAAATTMVASYYWQLQATASGEIFAPDGLTAAHRALPMGMLLTVRRGRKAVTVRVNDRGPYIQGRDIDLSRGAARALGMENAGVAKVAVKFPVPRPRPPEAPAIAPGESQASGFEDGHEPAAEVADAPAATVAATVASPRPAPIDAAERANIFRAFEQGLLRPAARCFEYESLDRRVKRLVSDAARHFGGVAYMTSCYRSAAYNRVVYARMGRRPTKSLHIQRKAIDFRIAGVSRDRLAAWLWRQNGVGGIGRYRGSEIVHVDVGRRREWCWGCGRMVKTRAAKRRTMVAMR